MVKLCDFGVSEMFVVEKSDDRIRKSGGSPAFLSPESFTCELSTGVVVQSSNSRATADTTAHTHEVHGKLVDIWALGMFWTMLKERDPANMIRCDAVLHVDWVITVQHGEPY